MKRKRPYFDKNIIFEKQRRYNYLCEFRKKRKKNFQSEQLPKKQRIEEQNNLVYCVYHGEKYICDIYDCFGKKEKNNIITTTPSYII